MGIDTNSIYLGWESQDRAVRVGTVVVLSRGGRYQPLDGDKAQVFIGRARAISHRECGICYTGDSDDTYEQLFEDYWCMSDVD